MRAMMRVTRLRSGRRACRDLSAAGFTLLEAIVALVLIGATLVPLFGLLSRNLDSIRRIGESNLRNEVTLNVLALVQNVNPMEVPAGQQQLGPYQIRWSATPLTGAVDGVGYPAGQSLFQLAMYNTRIEVRREAVKQPGVTRQDPMETWFFIDLRQLGWKQVRQFRIPF